MEVTQNNIHENSSRGFTVPSFLKRRKISSLDIPELQELFRINSIFYFGELTVEMLKDYLKISYAKAITVIRYLGLYGVIFYSPKLKRFSAQAEEKPLIIKSPRTETTVPVLERVYVFLTGFMYREYRAKLYRFLSDLKMTSNFLLDGVDINVLSRACDIPSYVIKSLLDLKFYENTYDIYYTEKDTEFVNEIKNILENNKHQNKDVQKRSSTDKVVKNECKSLNEDEPLPTNVQKVPSYIAHMDLPIDEFSTRLKGALFNNNITTVEDILKLGFSKFSRLENVGKNTVRELSLFLNKYDVNFNSNQSYQIDEMEAPLQFIEEMNKKNALPKENIQSIPSYIAQMELPMREFSTRLRSALELNSINTIKDALEFGFIHFFRLENVGRNTIKELSLFLNKYNINLEKPYEIYEAEAPDNFAEMNISQFNDELEKYRNKVSNDARQYEVYTRRICASNKATLQELALQFNVTRERIRQMEIKLLKKPLDIFYAYQESFSKLFEKYGEILSFNCVPELELLSDKINLLDGIFSSDENLGLVIDNEGDLILRQLISIDELIDPNFTESPRELNEIKNAVSEKLSYYVKNENEESIKKNFNVVCDYFCNKIINEYYVFDTEKQLYIPEDSSKAANKISEAFKKLFPKGVLLNKQIDNIYQKVQAEIPEIDLNTPKALTARILNNPNIILVDRGKYQHIDTISYSEDAVDYGLLKCKEKIEVEPHGFYVGAIYEADKKYFNEHGISSEYLLYSLMKLKNDPDLLFYRLTIRSSDIDQISVLENFELYFKQKQGVIPTEDVERHFKSSGWNDLKIMNCLNQSHKVFRISSGYFYKKNLSINEQQLDQLLQKIENKVKEQGYVSLEFIKKHYFVNWLAIYNQENLDVKSMATLIKAFRPKFKYEVSPWGMVGSGNITSPKDALYQWLNQLCYDHSYVTTSEIINFCEANGFKHNNNVRAQIKDLIAEIDDDCWISYEYAGINDNIVVEILGLIEGKIRYTDYPYLDLEEFIKQQELPKLDNNCEWSPILLRSLLEKRGCFTIFNLALVNPFQTKVITKDQLIAFILSEFSHTWLMPADKLERLLRRNNIIKRNETLTGKVLQNEIFTPLSCIELRDQGKTVCIKQEYKELYCEGL